MKFSEAVDGALEGLGSLPPEKKTRLVVSVGTAALLAHRLPFILAVAAAWLAGAGAEAAHQMLADMHDLTVKQAAYLAALSEKAAVDAAGDV